MKFNKLKKSPKFQKIILSNVEQQTGDGYALKYVIIGLDEQGFVWKSIDGYPWEVIEMKDMDIDK